MEINSVGSAGAEVQFRKIIAGKEFIVVLDSSDMH
jgi:hypothetical protein